MSLLEVSGLCVDFAGPQGWQTVVDDVSFSITAGTTLGLVGESGSGKTVSGLAVMGLLPKRASRVRGSVRYEGRDLAGLPDDAMRKVRGSEIGMVFQEPMSSLNPAFTIGDQIAETVRAHEHVSRDTAWKRGVEMLELVGISDPARRAKDYPHALSGGMRQRAMIAMALSCKPKLLIADEPTTALDVTIQAQVLQLLRSLQSELGTAILFITHDLGVVADIADQVTVLYAGQVVEQGSADRVFRRPQHPYTEGLLDALPQLVPHGEPLRAIPGQVPRPGLMPPGCRFGPRCRHAVDACHTAAVQLTKTESGIARCIRIADLTLEGSGVRAEVTRREPEPAPTPSDEPLLELVDVSKSYPVLSGVLRREVGRVRAVDGVSLQLRKGETLGLVGESGSGKSTTGRLALRLEPPTSGTVRFQGRDLATVSAKELRAIRRGLQVVFQDPYSSLDPRATIAESVGEPLEVHEGLKGRRRDDRVVQLLDAVGLGAHTLRRYPHEFSGGQRQRIAVARALALDPSVVVCDEPVSALDVSTQSQVVNLLADLQERLGLSYLFIGHDLSVVRHVSDRVAVMYLGQVVEVGPAEELYRHARHPYTQALLAAVPIPDPERQRQRERVVLHGDVPSPLNPPAGCRFHTRCPLVMPQCREVEPPVSTYADGRGEVRCHLHPTSPARPLATLDLTPAARPARKP
ncbi:MAG TPA: ABC transporter ATP-binding protein [Mycobacteriales bacterium]|nr:ABC transporter ATP-binding protein [Mycobacteriales bacterium]